MNRPILNRTLIALTGTVLLGTGILLLAGALHLNHRWHLGLHLPPATGPHRTLLTTAQRTRWSHTVWWWPTLCTALGTTTALGLYWLVAQLRRDSTPDFTLTHPSTSPGTLRLRGSALARSIAQQTLQIPGVHKARVKVSGRHEPHVRITLTLLDTARPETALRDLAARPLAQARSSTAGAVPTDVRIRTSAGPSSRVV